MDAMTYKTMDEAVRGLKARGFGANFEFLKDAFLDVATGKTFQPGDLTIVEHHRFEGVSDPDDLSIVYAIEAKDGTRGALTDGYGAYANPDLSSFLKKVPMKEDL